MLVHVKPNGTAWRHGRARLDLSYKEAAERLRIAPRYLLNIESNQPSATPSERLVYRAAALYNLQFDDLVAGDDETTPPADPPTKPEREPSGDPSGPPARRNGKHDRRGPARATDTAEAGAA